LELLRFVFEVCRLTLELWRLTLEVWTTGVMGNNLESKRLILKMWRLKLNAGVYILVQKLYLFLPPSENEIFSHSHDMSF
jgi:hypothetical protein